MNRALLLLLALLASGCGRHYARIETLTAPGVSRNDAIAVVVPNNPSMRERRAETLLRDELCRAGFTVVNEPGKATYVLTYGVDRHDNDVQKTTFKPGWFYPEAITTTEAPDPMRTRMTVTLTLFEAVHPDAGSIWEGAANVTQREWEVYGPVVFKVLLDQFGNDYQGESLMPKSYLYAIQDGPACVLPGVKWTPQE